MKAAAATPTPMASTDAIFLSIPARLENGQVVRALVSELSRWSPFHEVHHQHKFEGARTSACPKALASS